MSYNGWKNKETWLVNLWLGDYFESLQEKGTPVTEDFIRETVEEFTVNELQATGFAADLFNCALGEIDYREIAAYYVTENKES